MVEYAGLIVLAALILTGIVSYGLPANISGGVGTAICRIFNGTNCGPQDAGPGGTSPGDRPVTDPGGNSTPEPHAPSPVTIPNVLNGAGSYFATTAAGIGDFFKRWILPDPPKPDGGPTQGWPGFWHGLWRSVWDDNLKHVPEELLGAGKEIVDQIVGIGDLVKLSWCAGGVPRRCSEKDTEDARNTLKYVKDHPGDALKQAGKSIIEPCKTAVEHGGYEQAGRCGASIITTIIGAKGLNKLGKLGKLGRAGKAGKAAKLATLWKNARGARDLEVRARSLEHAAKEDPTAANKSAAARARKAANDAWKKAGSGVRNYRSPKKGTPEYQKRYDELSKDPAHGGKVTRNSKREAEVGLDLESQGRLPGPIQRSPLGKATDGSGLDLGEFFDRSGKAWDVKGFKDKFPLDSKKNPGQTMPEGTQGRYSRTKARDTIQKEINGGKNIILDSRDLSPAAHADLDNLVKSEPGWKGKVIWYP